MNVLLIVLIINISLDVVRLMISSSIDETPMKLLTSIVNHFKTSEGWLKSTWDSALEGIDDEDVARIIFVYEPIWAIGTGISATSDQAEEICAFTKKILSENFGLENSIVLYGGSLKAENAQDILSKKSIDGGLIGGACLKIDEFEKIINTKVDEWKKQ